MSPRILRSLKVLGLGGVLWVVCLVPLPGPPWLETVKPALLAAVFSIVSCRVNVDSWPLIIAFSLTFFIYTVIDLIVGAYLPTHGDSAVTLDASGPLVYLAIVTLSPVSLWAPVISGASTYAIIRKRSSSLHWSGP